MAGIALPRADIPASPAEKTGTRRIAGLIIRYGMTALGPVAISGAHFAVSLIFLHELPPAEFGLFSFLLVVVPFCMSISGALLGAPISTVLAQSEGNSEFDRATYHNVNLALSLAAGLGVGGVLLLSHAGLLLSALLGGYGTAMTLRWFARSVAYVTSGPKRALVSDLLYSGLLVGGLAALIFVHSLTIENAGRVLLGASVLSLFAFGWRDLRDQLRPGSLGSFAAYAPVWRDLSRWSLLGVILTEMTANALAYFVTFISGPQAFAVLALGGLLMRPVSLVLSALPDMERPIMARHIAAGDSKGAFRSVREFRIAAGAIWLSTIALAAVIVIWFPHFLLKKGYDGDEALIAIALWAVIAAVRALRTPEAVFLMAAGEYRPLAQVGMKSSITSLCATLILLLLFGPVASLGGILAGDIVITANVFSLTRAWRRSHA